MNRNDKLRTEFADYMGSDMSPSLTKIYKKIGLTYTYIIDWQKGRKEFGSEALDKIDNFLSKYHRD